MIIPLLSNMMQETGENRNKERKEERKKGKVAPKNSLIHFQVIATGIVSQNWVIKRNIW